MIALAFAVNCSEVSARPEIDCCIIFQFQLLNLHTLEIHNEKLFDDKKVFSETLTNRTFVLMEKIYPNASVRDEVGLLARIVISGIRMKKPLSWTR